LDDLVRQTFNHDFPEKVYEENVEMSIEDKQFMHIMSTSATMKDGHMRHSTKGHCNDHPPLKSVRQTLNQRSEETASATMLE
jgi:hypothetical protein